MLLEPNISKEDRVVVSLWMNGWDIPLRAKEDVSMFSRLSRVSAAHKFCFAGDDVRSHRVLTMLRQRALAYAKLDRLNEAVSCASQDLLDALNLSAGLKPQRFDDKIAQSYTNDVLRSKVTMPKRQQKGTN